MNNEVGLVALHASDGGCELRVAKRNELLTDNFALVNAGGHMCPEGAHVAKPVVRREYIHARAVFVDHVLDTGHDLLLRYRACKEGVLAGNPAFALVVVPE